MRTIVISALTVIASLGLSYSAQAATIFRSQLNGNKIIDSNGNPAPTGSSAIGFATLELNDAQTQLAYSITLNNLALDTAGGTVSKIHFHRGFANQRSPFHVFNIYGPKDDADAVFGKKDNPITVSGIWSDTDYCFTPAKTGFTCDTDPDTTKKLSDYVDELLAGGIYINVHTTAFASGEIRGQIEAVPVPEPSTILSLGTVLTLSFFSKKKPSQRRNKQKIYSIT
ncbi:CHRD domain-containing protein [Nostoc sp. MS1]|uniref:CHRD domain-containing protein n=1 Tax=Nostoc sp. MS1 TaxID=2764711 RepID=UPI001CC63F8E|nr:CHRD domain-containing protein [Nostoc sp. MS1]BCL38122.1 hypothetical protein NSMS1_45690 [Nostoc sp. MS1]